MNIREWRTSRGLTQRLFAEQLGISQATLSKIECGASQPTRQTAKRIEAATDGEVSAAELLGLTGSAPKPGGMSDSPRAFEADSINVPVPSDLADMARKYGLDVEALIAEGGVPRLRAAFKAAYIERHKEAIDEINASVREHGTLSQRFGML